MSGYPPPLGRFASLLLVAAMGVLLVPLPARADPARARAHFELGRRYFQVDEYRKAIEEFKAAHVEEADPAFLYNIAECHRRLGENREALTYYRRFLKLSPANAPSRANAEKRITELQSAPDMAAGSGAAPAPEPKAAPPASDAGGGAPAGGAPPVTSAPAPAAEPPPAGVVGIGASTTAPPPSETAEARPFYTRGWFFVT